MTAGKPRSGRWPTVRRQHLAQFPECAACGSKQDLEVHHCKPYHLHPEDELREENLVTLCNYHHCHEIFGHLCSWQSFNVDVRKDAAAYRQKVEQRP